MESNYPTVGKERNFELLSTGNFSDVTFIVGKEERQKTFKAHKLLLAAASEVFSAMFYGPMAETTEIIPIPDAEPEGFEKMLRYIYIDDTILETPEISFLTLPVANKYMLHYLQKICYMHILSSITVETVCKVLEVSYTYELERGKMMAMYFICRNTKRVLMSEGFLDAHIDIIEKITSQENLNISEEKIIDAIVQWAQRECERTGRKGTWENIRSVTAPLLPHIRLLALSSEQFISLPLEDKLLSCDDTVPFLMNFIMPGSKPYPNWCCQKGKRTKLHNFQFCAIPDSCRFSTPHPPDVVQTKFTSSTKYMAIGGARYYESDSKMDPNMWRSGTVSLHIQEDGFHMSWPVPTQALRAGEFVVMLPVQVILLEGETCEISFRAADGEKKQSSANGSVEDESSKRTGEFIFHKIQETPYDAKTSFESLIYAPVSYTINS